MSANPKTILPPVLLSHGESVELALKPEHIDVCVRAFGKEGKIVGSKFSPFSGLCSLPHFL